MVSRPVWVLLTAHFGSCFQGETAQDSDIRFWPCLAPRTGALKILLDVCVKDSLRSASPPSFANKPTTLHVYSSLQCPISTFFLFLVPAQKSGDWPSLSDASSECRNLPAPHARCVEKSFYVSVLAVFLPRTHLSTCGRAPWTEVYFSAKRWRFEGYPCNYVCMHCTGETFDQKAIR